MDQAAPEVLYKEQEVAVALPQTFDGLDAYKQIRDRMPPVGCVNRIVLDFSGFRSVKAIELYCLLSAMETSPRFANIEIILEGLGYAWVDFQRD